MTDIEMSVTAYYYADALLISKFAGILGLEEDKRSYLALANTIKNSFNAKFYKGGGVYSKGEQTAQGTALYFGLVEDSERESVVEKLVKSVEATGGKPDFGILGAKYVPRALADNGYADLAFKLITQKDYPGWGYWMAKGSSTLWESWLGTSSLNHIMFGDISAWMYQYLAGIRPDPERPGFKHVFIKPCFVSGLDWARAEHISPQGKISVAWKQKGRSIDLNVKIPDGMTATVMLQHQEDKKLGTGKHSIPIKIGNGNAAAKARRGKMASAPSHAGLDLHRSPAG